MQLSGALKIKEGLTAIIGSGGKSALIQRLIRELSPDSRVIVYSPYPMMLPNGAAAVGTCDADAIRAVLDSGRAAAIGREAGGGRLLPIDADPEILISAGDHVLCEADNSVGLPLIAHGASSTPPIPKEANRVIAVLGLSGLCRPVSMAALNPLEYSRKSGLAVNDFVSPEAAARVINTEGLHDCLFINQADSKEWYSEAQLLAACIHSSCVIGSLHKNSIHNYK